MASWDGDQESGGSDRGSGDFREDVGPADPSPVTDEMITPRTSPGPVPSAPEDNVACRVCGEMNASNASYCLACGVTLTDSRAVDPLPWEDEVADDPLAFDPGEGLVDLGEMSEVTPLRQRNRDENEEGDDEDIDARPPRDIKKTVRTVLWSLLGLALLFLAFTTFRGESTDAEPTSTTLSINENALATYSSEVASIGATVAELSASAIAINGAWDDRNEDFDTTLSELRFLSARAAVLADLLSDLTVPEVIGGVTHQRLITSATTLAESADEMVDGLEGPDSGEVRHGALAKFEAAAVEFASFVAVVDQTVESVSETEAEDTEG